MQSQSLDVRLEKFPELKASFEKILNMAEIEGQYAEDDAHSIEEKMVVDLKQTGQHILNAWAHTTAQKEAEKVQASGLQVKKHQKKGSTGIQQWELSKQ